MEITQDQRTAVIVTFVIYTVVMLILSKIASSASKGSLNVNKFADDYFASGRGLGGLVVGLTAGAALCSAGTFVAVPGACSIMGFSYALLVFFSAAVSFVFFSAAVSFVVCAEAGKKIGVVSRRCGAVSIVGLLKNRYDNTPVISILSVVSLVIFLVSYSASQFVGGARLLENLMGLPYVWGLFIFFAILFIYTVFGGMKGVSIAAVFQGGVMTVAALTLLFGTIALVNENGGYQHLFEQIAQGENAKFMGDYNPWQFTVNILILNSVTLIAQPHILQSTFTTKSTKAFHASILIGIVFTGIWQFSMGFVGLSSTVAGLNPQTTDWASSVMALTVLPPWLSGVLVAGAMGAIQSTVGGMMVVVSSSVVKDFYLEFINTKATGNSARKVAMTATGLGLILAFLFAVNPPSLLQDLVNYSMNGLVSCFFVPLFLGLLWKRANKYGAIAGMFFGLAYFLVGSNVPELQFFGLNPAVISIILNFAVVIVISLCTEKPALGTVLTWFYKDYPKEIVEG